MVFRAMARLSSIVWMYGPSQSEPGIFPWLLRIAKTLTGFRFPDHQAMGRRHLLAAFEVNCRVRREESEEVSLQPMWAMDEPARQGIVEAHPENADIPEFNRGSSQAKYRLSSPITSARICRNSERKSSGHS